MADRPTKGAKYPLPDVTYQTIAEKLYAPLLYKENAVMLCPPLWGRDHNVRFLWERPWDRTRVLGTREKRFQFGHVQLTLPERDATIVWMEQLASSLCLNQSSRTFASYEKALKRLTVDHLEPTFFVNIPESISDEQLVAFLALAQSTYYIAPNVIHFLILLDMKWDEEHFFRLTAPFRSLFQHTIQPTLYSYKETAHLATYWLNAWDHTLERNALSCVVEYAGGILLLAKAAVRVAVRYRLTTLDDIEQVFSHPDYLTQVKFFLSRLTPLQREILVGVAKGKSAIKSPEYNHLLAMGIIRETAGNADIRSKAIYAALAPVKIQTSRLQTRVKETKNFSPREKEILIAVLRSSSHTFSREAIAKILWGDDNLEIFSDWALDQAMSRIRKKLKTTQEFSRLTLETKKKHGFRLIL